MPKRSPSAVGVAARRCSVFASTVRPRRAAKTGLPLENWRRRADTWGRLMVAAQGGDVWAYEQLFRELDAWLRRYYAARLPRAAAEDTRQEALLAIHTKRYAYTASRSFGAWVAAVACYKWIDCLRKASRAAVLALRDEIPIGDHGDTVISAIVVDVMLARLAPAQASVIRTRKVARPQHRGRFHRDRSIRSARQGQHPSRSKAAGIVGCLRYRQARIFSRSRGGAANLGTEAPGIECEWCLSLTFSESCSILQVFRTLFQRALTTHRGVILYCSVWSWLTGGINGRGETHGRYRR